MTTTPRERISNLLATIDNAANKATPEHLARGLKVALLFAVHSANTRVPKAERDVWWYHRAAIVPSYYRTRWVAASEDIDRYIDADIAVILKNGTALDAISWLDGRIHGLGPCKAAFGLALAGFFPLPCVDRWVARKYGIAPERIYRLGALRNKRTAAARYLAFARGIYGDKDARLEQWLDFYEEVPTFRSTLHLSVIRLVLECYEGANPTIIGKVA